MTSRGQVSTSQADAEDAEPAEPQDGVRVLLTAVSRSYRSRGALPVTALDEVYVDIAAGEVLAVVGPSGSGKSTLLHIMGGMDRPDSGEVWVGDGRIDRLSAQDLALFRRRVGFVFQRFHLMPALSVTDNVLVPLVPRRVPFDRRARALELLDAVGMADRSDALPAELSGGQQQRVAIARALICSPSLLLADEPTGSLDSTTGRSVMELMFDLARSRRCTVAVATHDPDVSSLCERTLHVRDGRVVGTL